MKKQLSFILEKINDKNFFNTIIEEKPYFFSEDKEAIANCYPRDRNFGLLTEDSSECIKSDVKGIYFIFNEKNELLYIGEGFILDRIKKHYYSEKFWSKDEDKDIVQKEKYCVRIIDFTQYGLDNEDWCNKYFFRALEQMLYLKFHEKPERCSSYLFEFDNSYKTPLLD